MNNVESRRLTVSELENVAIVVTVATEVIAVVVVEEAAIIGEEDVVIEISIVAMGEALTVGARDTLGHQEDAIHEIEAHSEGLQGNQILMFPVAEEDRDETTVPELPPTLDRPLLYDPTLVLHLAVVRILPPGHALLLLAGDPEHPTDEETPIEVAEDGEEEEVQTGHHVEDHPLHPEARARVPQGHRNVELPRTLLAHLLRLDLDVLAVIPVPYLGPPPDRLVGPLTEGHLAAEKGFPRTSRKIIRIRGSEVVNAG
ncbi:hypothetical protein L207DRAFT_32503 [Hyaloscypha variabilis F]|uniref:Uncharacterized protein n=1 Tax=Hyaloscypha variabilis (strain UAMH 11265 / GT02V1 / F) TaxID=1149755 RepID=A0A2J6RN17_HYAVF|nr:hypothetical protein L207DRAFT_32503 [Hyaloscypha variabilis F]